MVSWNTGAAAAGRTPWVVCAGTIIAPSLDFVLMSLVVTWTGIPPAMKLAGAAYAMGSLTRTLAGDGVALGAGVANDSRGTSAVVLTSREGPLVSTTTADG
mmetsp:Transcript_45567/g.105693  ORF Transcript_45567/g.105693 Transcript_45567/m.105693 type:complete len:101 (+) Transcript_45567:1243-1545(+)